MLQIGQNNTQADQSPLDRYDSKPEFGSLKLLSASMTSSTQGLSGRKTGTNSPTGRLSWSNESPSASNGAVEVNHFGHHSDRFGAGSSSESNNAIH